MISARQNTLLLCDHAEAVLLPQFTSGILHNLLRGDVNKVRFAIIKCSNITKSTISFLMVSEID